MATVSHKLRGSFEGALAGGGDPASSPLYVFGPFLKLIVSAGVASITFGASIWLAVLTVVTVSAVYKFVMKWIIDGSGGTGLCEEEFGGWAVKINAGITIIEYTLTFLVSVAALVTFSADRFHQWFSELNAGTNRFYLAAVVSVLIGLGVNFGPRMSAKIFGPATFGILVLLWLMMIATVWHLGLHPPSLHLSAFNLDNIHYTLGGYARILALMTGIEVFANLVPAYEGPAAVRSKKAFGSLVIIMATTSLTMLIVGPAILHLAHPEHPNVSVFTQTMDILLPMPLAYLGTFLGVMVLFSAAAASLQGIQNLSLGLRYRHYIPAKIGAQNRFGVADKPAWFVVILCICCFVFFGTNEETYLALYAAGVFILLSLTSWAAVKRLTRTLKQKSNSHTGLFLFGSILAAILTSLATIVILEERFVDGAWIYLLLIPIFYLYFKYIRSRLGKPEMISERIGMAITSSTLPQSGNLYFYSEGIRFKNILVPLDQSPPAEYAISVAQTMARNYGGSIHLLTICESETEVQDASMNTPPESVILSAKDYLNDIREDLEEADYRISIDIRSGHPAEEITRAASNGTDILIMTSQGKSLVHRWITSNITKDVIQHMIPPMIILRPTEQWRSIRTRFKRLLVALDGSQVAETILPFAKEIAAKFGSQVTLLTVPEASDSDKMIQDLHVYLDKIALDFSTKGIRVKTLVSGQDPAHTIMQTSNELNTDLVMVASHGRGGIERQRHVKLGSVVDALLQKLQCPMFLVSHH